MLQLVDTSPAESDFDLSPAQRAHLESRAASGDRTAAMKLREYHMMISGDTAAAERWQRRVDELSRRR